MKVIKIVSICLVIIVLGFASFKMSENIIGNKNSTYVQKNPTINKKISKNETSNTQTYYSDVDKFRFHSVYGTKGTSLPVKYDKNYTVYENKLYVTNNNGKTWLKVPDDNQIGYARISEYVKNITESNIYVSNDKIYVVYGGIGSENIAIMSTTDNGDCWGVVTISKTATHDLKKGYDKLYIDFLDDGKNGYIASVRKSGKSQQRINAYRTVDTGVTWEPAEANSPFYSEIMKKFGL
ncbi:MAG: hypothetical protein PHX70_14095 [Clostridium sp.]|nr:hypothetical protein [Clostridium sp.]